MRAQWLVVWLCVMVLGSATAHSIPLSGQSDPAQFADAMLHRVDVIGKDQRIRLPKELAGLGRGIGIVFQSGGGWACTAFCVKPSVIATNAHCLFGRPGQRKAVRLDRTKFALAKDRDGKQFRTSSLRINDIKQPGLSIYSGYYRSRQSLLAFRNDWALTKLRSPICRGAELELSPMSPQQIAREARNNRLSLIGFHGDKQMDGQWLSRPCRIRSSNDRRHLLPSQRRGLRSVSSLVLHTCDATRGASGAPLLVHTQNGFKVVAINAGTIGFTKYRRTRTGRRGRAVVSRATNVAVTSQSFAGGLERFSSERLLEAGQSFQKVQQLLRQAGYYNGAIDGLYGPATRSAIVQYEQRHRLAALGLPTSTLLKHLETNAGSASPAGHEIAQGNRSTAAALSPSGRKAIALSAAQQQASMVLQIQQRLSQLGCYRGPLDGLWGPQSQQALRVALGTGLFDQPNAATLARLRARPTQICK